MAQLTSTEPIARLRAHSRNFGEHRVLRAIDFEIAPTEFVALLGRSGCGKSTLLRSLARLDPVADSEVRINGRTAVAFQEPRLLPWRRVRDNVELALIRSPLRASLRHERATATLTEVGLANKLDAWPKELSGGQAQRTSLARALVDSPDLLLLDEPFSALDALTRIEMHQLLIDLWREHQMAVLLVTHDVDEALALADRIVVLDQGRVANTWQISSRRDNRAATNPEIARIRAGLLQSLGVRPTAPNPHRHRDESTNQGAA